MTKPRLPEIIRSFFSKTKPMPETKQQDYGAVLKKNWMRCVADFRRTGGLS